MKKDSGLSPSPESSQAPRFFAHWEERLEVKEFPEGAVEDIKKCALLVPIPDCSRGSWASKVESKTHQERHEKAERVYAIPTG